MPLSFEEEFPNEPFAPTGVGGTASTGYTGGYVAPGNLFTGISLGGAADFYIESEAERTRKSLPEVGAGYVFVAGEGFVEVRDSPYFEESPPTDWETVSANYESDATPAPVPPRPAPVFSPADIEVIDPDYAPDETVFETSSGPTGESVAFWETVGEIFTTSAPEYASQWITSQFQPKPYTGAYRTPLTMPGAPSGPGAAPYAARAASNVVPIVQDQQLCAVPATNPRYLRYNCQTGEFSKVPRRRRRRLLTSSDLKDLAALKTIVGGGASMSGAVVQAIRR